MANKLDSGVDFFHECFSDGGDPIIWEPLRAARHIKIYFG